MNLTISDKGKGCGQKHGNKGGAYADGTESETGKRWLGFPKYTQGGNLMQGTHDFSLFNHVTKYTISSKINATIQYTSPCQDPFKSSKN